MKNTRTTESPTVIIPFNIILSIFAILLTAFLILSILFQAGCVKRELVFVTPTVPVRLAEPIDATVVSPDGVLGTTTIPAGVWITYDPAEWYTPDGKPTTSTLKRTTP